MGLEAVLKEAQQAVNEFDQIGKQAATGTPSEGENQGSPPEVAPVAPVVPLPKQPEQPMQPSPSLPAQTDASSILKPPSEDRKWEEMYRTAEQKLRVLQGKYDAEVPRLHQELRDFRQRESILQSQVSTFEQRIDQLEKAIQQNAVKKPDDQQLNVSGDVASSGDLPNFEALANAYPEDLAPIILLVGKQTNTIREQNDQIQELKQMLGNALTQINQVNAQVGEVQNREVNKAFNDFRNHLTALCPEWQQIDDMPDFANWLDVQQPMSVRTRRQDAAEAWKMLDAGLVAQFYNAFKSQFLSTLQNNQPPNAGNVSTQAPATAPTQVQTNAQAQAARPWNPLEQMVEPGKAAGNPPADPNSGRIYTAAEIQAFYDSAGKNPKLMSDPAWVAQEKDISLAFQQGRITGQPPVGKLTAADMALASR